MKKSSSSSLHKKSQLLFGFCYSFFRFIFCFLSRFFLFQTAFILSHFHFQITPADIIWNLLLFKLHTEIDGIGITGRAAAKKDCWVIVSK